MLQQLSIDFVSRKQNSKENQEILEEAKPRLKQSVPNRFRDSSIPEIDSNGCGSRDFL
jgi:Ser-tRNA(Ala) deacylase AlaX